MTTLKLKKGDTVQMLAGKDRGKQGRIIEARPRDGKVIVENLNMHKKHQKPRPIRDASRMGGTQIAPGGIISTACAGVDVERDARLPDVQAADARRLPLQGDQGRRAAQGARLQARRLWPGDRPLMAAVEQTYVPRLKQRYNDELRAQLREELGLSSIMQAPTIAKITLNMGVGEGKTDAKQIDAALEELTIIAGQRAQVRRARKSIAQFKIRDGMPIGVQASRCAATGCGSSSTGSCRSRCRASATSAGSTPTRSTVAGTTRSASASRSSFPEIDYDSINQVRGLDVAITTTAARRRAGARAPHGARPAVRGRWRARG